MNRLIHKIVLPCFLLASNQLLGANPIQNLINQALANGDSAVTIPPGTYRVSATLQLSNLHDFSIIADGVTMVLTQRRKTMDIDNCSNLMIQGLALDIDPLPFTQATITAHADDWSWLEAQIHEGYPQDPSETTKLEVYDGGSGLLLPNVWTVYDATVQKLSPDTIRVSETNRLNGGNVAMGDKIVVECPEINVHAVLIDDSINCTFSNVTLHASTSFGFLESRCHGNQYLGVRIIPGPSPVPGGEPRLRSLNADGIHSKHATLGPRIENCTIACNGDDGVAINGDYDLILEASGNTVIIASKRDTEIQAGDPVRSFSTAGTIDFEAVVSAIAPVSGYNQLRDDVLAGSGLQNASLFQNTHQLTLSSSISAVAGSAICAINRSGDGFIVRNNYIFNKRARGILIKASDGLIEGNRIEYNHMGAIVMAPELYWMESGFSRSVRIINNKISHCGLNPNNNGTTQAGVITISAAGNSDFTPAGGHRDIEISGNRIDNSLGTNILAASISGLNITNNVLVNTHSEIRTHGISRGVDPYAGVVIINCSDVTLDNNTVPDFGGNTFLLATNVTSITGMDTFSAEPQSFINFQLLHEVAAASDDDDHDQMQNLSEFFLGRNPTVIDTLHSLSGIIVAASNATFHFVGPQGGRNGVWAEVQRASTLEPADWTAIATRDGVNPWVSAATLTSQPHSTEPDWEQLKLSEPIDEISSSIFYRLSLSTAPPLLLDPITYSASADFSSVQGAKSWYYQEHDGTDYSNLTWDGVNNRWQGTKTFLRVFVNASHPEVGLDAVRKWVAPDDGVVTITGDVNRSSASGDGVVASIRKNATNLWSNTVLPGIPVTPTGVENISVSGGDAIYFLVNRNLTATSDYTAWNPTIKFSRYDN